MNAGVHFKETHPTAQNIEFPNEHSWGYKFADDISIVTNLENSFCVKIIVFVFGICSIVKPILVCL